MRRLRVAFVVQGEGRGHMTQALALAGWLKDAGHELVRVFVGRSPFRSIPGYFEEEMGTVVEAFDAPTQVPDSARRGVSRASTALDALRRLPAFLRAGARIHSVTRSADVVVNFLDLVAALSRLFYRTRAPALAIAHNYVFLHPLLRGVSGRPRGQGFVMGYTRATSACASRTIALSFDPLPDVGVESLVVAPPLLRPGLDDEREVPDRGHLLAYALNPGYGDLLVRWHRRNPDVTVHCYLDGGSSVLGEPPAAGFHAHPLGDEGFLRHLRGCRAYVGTAGFESICEAYYLGKPALVIPTKGQFEQELNAWDAQRVGAAQPGGYEDLDSFWRDPVVPSLTRVEQFRAWVRKAPEVLVREVERAARATHA